MKVSPMNRVMSELVTIISLFRNALCATDSIWSIPGTGYGHSWPGGDCIMRCKFVPESNSFVLRRIRMARSEFKYIQRSPEQLERRIQRGQDAELVELLESIPWQWCGSLPLYYGYDAGIIEGKLSSFVR